MPYINVDEAYILDNTGLQVDNSVDYANANSNRNLLDNPFFTVNQRQVTSANFTNAYCVDRWRTVNIMTVNASNTGYIILKNAYANDASEFIQMIPLDLRGKTVTATVKLRDGSIYTKTGVLSESAQWGNLVEGWSFGFSYATSNSTSRFRIYSPNNTTSILYVAAVKLELGSYSTLINDTPPDYGEELAKCRYYFERISAGGSRPMTLGFGYPDGYNTLYAHFKINPKRTTSLSIVTGSSFVVGDGSSMSTAASSASIYNFLANGEITVALTATGAFTPPNLYRCGIPANGYVDFSADL